MTHTYSSESVEDLIVELFSSDQPGKVANPTRGQLNKENEYSPVPVRA